MAGPDGRAVRTVAVLAAMVPELKPLRKRLGLRGDPFGDTTLYCGQRGGVDVFAGVTSMGTANARALTARVLDALPVDHLIVIGIAGGLPLLVRIGDLVVPEVCIDSNTGGEHHPVAIGRDVLHGKIWTTDVLEHDEALHERLRSEGVLALDMETATIGAVCEERGVPWTAYRGISDLAGDPTIDDEVLHLAKPDGTANPRAVARFVVTKPLQVRHFPRLARGMHRATAAATDAAIRALDELGEPHT